MEIKIQSIHFSPSEVLNAKIEKKLVRAFSKYPYIKQGDVFLKLQGNDPEKGRLMEIRIPLPHGELFAETREESLYNALDRNIDKLKRQLEKYKERVYTNP